MGSMFWRIFASFWLAIVLVAGFSVLLGRALNQDALILATHPALKQLPERWVAYYEAGDFPAARRLLEQRKRHQQLDVQVLNEEGQPLSEGTLFSRAAAFEARAKPHRLPWRRLTEQYESATGSAYLFIYRIPHSSLHEWQRGSLLLPLGALLAALLVLTLLSLRLTLSITRPLQSLRGAVHDLGRTAYQQQSLARLATRRDEFGLLAEDFNQMGQRLQGLIASQRQLLRDVSHELRSPLARLKIALALAERADEAQRRALWPRLDQECNRLEALISEILTLARLDAEPGGKQAVDLPALLHKLADDARLQWPEQHLELHLQALQVQGWPDMLERAIDNLLRNALRFNPPQQPVEIHLLRQGNCCRLDIRDHGPGVAAEHLARLGEPFFRALGQSSTGHGLGLAIARRAAERLGGSLVLSNHAQGGLLASLLLPLE